MVYNCVFWLNSFPHKDGVHDTLSPRAIMTGQKIQYDKHCKVEFGTYVQVHEKHNNSMESRTSGAIALRPSGNEQGEHYFLSLHTGKRVLRNHWTVLPMPNDVVDPVHRLAVTSKQTGGITFTNKLGNIITEDDDGSESKTKPEDIPVPPNDDDHDIQTESDVMDQENTGVNDTPDTKIMETEMGAEYETAGVDHNDMNRTEYMHENNISTTNEESKPDNYITIADINITSELNASNREWDDIEEEESGGRTNARYNLRPKPRNTTQYTMMKSTKDSITLPKMHAHIMTTQLNVQEGLKAYGEKGDEAIMKEISQLHTRKALMPCSRNKMTYDERYLMFLKEKRDGSIKSRGCADGRTQRIYTNKEDASSPTVSIEAMVLSCAIDAKESR